MLASQDILVAVSFVANRRWLIAVVQTIAVHMKHQTTRQLSSLLSHLTSGIHIPLTVRFGSRPPYYSSYTPPSIPALIIVGRDNWQHLRKNYLPLHRGLDDWLDNYCICYI